MKNEKMLSEANIRKLIAIILGVKNNADTALDKCVLPYDDAKVYSKDDICFYNGTLYRAKTVTLGNTPSPESTYFEMLDGVEEEIDAQYIETLMSTVSAETWDYLKDFINNDIISTTHAWSSSRAYAEIQSAIQTAKDYTLEKVANSSTGSYVIVTGTDEIVDDKHLFLISNGSNYDIYALVNGAPTKIGDTSVSLNGLLTEATAETTYLKQADATATYATITTTDGLRTDLDNHTNDTVAHLTQAERDKLVTTDDIITTLDNTATDEQLASALATYKALDDKKIYHFSSPTEGDANTLVIKGKSAHYQISNAVITSGTIANLPPNLGVGGLLISHGLATIHQFFLTHNNRVYKRYGYWANTTDTEPTWVGTWEKIVTTKVEVADVPWTSLTLNDGMSGNMYYSVKNGICYVTVQSLSSATMGTSYQTITDNLPAPEITGVWYALASDDRTQGGLLAHINSTGKMINHVGIDNALYYGTFSYPVKES